MWIVLDHFVMIKKSEVVLDSNLHCSGCSSGHGSDMLSAQPLPPHDVLIVVYTSALPLFILISSLFIILHLFSEVEITYWSHEAVNLLLDLYIKHQSAAVSHANRNNVFVKITESMQNLGYR